MKLSLFILLLTLSLISSQNSTGTTHTPRPDEHLRHIYICVRIHESTSGSIEDGRMTCNGTEGEWDNADEMVIHPANPWFWFYLLGSLFFIMMAGMMSGLTLGFLGLDVTTLEVLKASGTDLEKRQAQKILPILKKHHLLLVTLLLMNSIAMESLPIFLVRLVSDVAAIIISVTLILVFGEVIPQALCNKYGLAIGATLNMLVWFLMLVTFPISWPISKLLDFLLGSENKTRYRRTEMKELVKMHAEHKDSNLSHDEVNIIHGALDLKHKSILHILKPIQDVFMLNISDTLNYDKKKEVLDSGHSRIPVYKGEKDKIVGMLLVKKLLQYGSDDINLSQLELKKIPEVTPQLPLYNLLNIFQTGKSHMAVVLDEETHKPLGIVTLEDLIEELIQEDITDESENPAKKLLKKEESEEDKLHDSDEGKPVKLDNTNEGIKDPTTTGQKNNQNNQEPEMKMVELEEDTESDDMNNL